METSKPGVRYFALTSDEFFQKVAPRALADGVDVVSTPPSKRGLSMSTPRMTCVEPKYFCTARMLTAAMLLLR